MAEVIPTIDEAERLARAGHWVVGFVAYEAAPAFDPALATFPSSAMPLVWFGVFDAPEVETSSPMSEMDSLLSSLRVGMAS